MGVLLIVFLMVVAIVFKKNIISLLKNKKVKIAIGTIVLLVIFCGIGFVLYKVDLANTEIPNDYFAEITAGTPEIHWSTYLYLSDDGKAKYICTQVSTISWGSFETYTEITKKGKINNIQAIFEIAKKNGSAGYVVINEEIPKNELHDEYKKGDNISIEEFKKILSEK